MLVDTLKQIFGFGWGMTPAAARGAIVKGSAPPGTAVDIDLNLRGTSIHSLPDGLRVEGNLDLGGARNLRALPSRLYVAGNLQASACTSLKEIPGDAFVNWSVELRNCTALERIADGFNAQWHLALDNCISLKELPRELSVGGDLRLIHCRALTSLPRTLKVDGTLYLCHCPELRDVPAELRARHLVIENCPKLRSLGEDVHVRESLSIVNCPDLRLPDGLKIEQNLSLRESAVEELPYQLTVGGHLFLSNCRNLVRLGTWLEVGGTLDVSGCAKLQSLDGVMSAEAIDVAGTKITAVPPQLKKAHILWRGVNVPAHVAFDPASITVSEILAERNAERRRVMLERYGIERFITAAKTELVHADSDRGGERKLLRIPFSDDEPLVCLQVHCPSTGALYILRVPPSMRTCHQAAAWIAGFDNPADYKPLEET